MSNGTPATRIVLPLFLGIGGGLVLCLPVFLALLWAMMSSHEGSLQSPLVLLAAPVYALMYVVVVFTVLVPTGAATGATAGLCAAKLRGGIGYAVVALVSILGGGWAGWRFVDICLEGTDTQTDRVIGAFVAAAVLAVGNVLLCRGLRKMVA